MINEIFVANTPKEAYNEAILKYGNNITVTSAKQVTYKDGMLRCEVTVAVPKDLFIKHSLAEDDSLLDEIKLLKKELSLMKEDMLGNESVSKQVKDIFRKKGISDEWLDNTVASLDEKDILEDKNLLTSYLLEEIDDSLEIEQESLLEPKIMMLVGSTGVGKTTTIAKLSARYAYMLDRPYKVGFINIDSYKIGAFEQLEHFADVMDMEYVNVESVEFFKDAIKSLSRCDIIFVDTTGMSPYDTQKFIKTIEFIKSDISRVLEVSLVLPANIKYEDMSDIYKNFSFLNLHSLIISKFDETKHFGTLLNFMLLYKIPMSYFSIGQEIPDDLVVASKEYILESFIGDFNVEDSDDV